MNNICLQKLKSELNIQKKKLEEYLVVVALEKKALLADRIMQASQYIQHEREIIKSVKAHQKVIPPLEAEIGEVVLHNSREINSLKNTLDALHKEVQEGIRTNHRILEQKKAGIEEELKVIRRNTASRRRSGYSRPPRSSMIDIQR